jgi:hypothetical protein
MGLTVGRFLVYFGVYAAILLAAAIGARSNEQDRTTEERERRLRRNPATEASRLAFALDLEARRDSIARALRAAPASRGVTVIFPRSASERMRAVVDSGLRAVWREAGLDSARSPMVLLLAADQAARRDPDVELLRFTYTLLPAVTDGKTCVTVAPVEDMSAANDVARRDFARRLVSLARTQLGACILHARFGPPGPGMSAWMRGSAWSVARATFLAEPETPATAAPVFLLAGPSIREAGSSGSLFTHYYLEFGSPELIGAEHIACIAGRRARCETSVLPSAALVKRRTFSLASRDVLRHSSFFSMGWWSDSFLSFTEREIGRDRFERLWRTDKPLPAAFEEVAGVSLGDVARRQLMKDHGPVSSTPWPTRFEWIGNLAIIAAALGVVARGRPRPA